MSKHPFNNEQTNNVLREEKTSFSFLLFLERTVCIWKPMLAVQNMKAGVFLLWWGWVLATESRVHWRGREIHEMPKKGR